MIILLQNGSYLRVSKPKRFTLVLALIIVQRTDEVGELARVFQVTATVIDAREAV